MSNFTFLKAEWPEVHESALKAERQAYSDPRTSCFYARRALEAAVTWMYRNDAGLRVPYQDNLSALIHDPAFQRAVGPEVFTKARIVMKLGNLAVHSGRTVAPSEALAATRELFHVCYWLARTYGRTERPPADLTFDADQAPKAPPLPRQAIAYIRQLQARLEEQEQKYAALEAEQLKALAVDRLTGHALDEALRKDRQLVAAARKANQARPDTHDYSEAATRDLYIDLLLKEAGWALDHKRDREYPVAGMPPDDRPGKVDYVLWGADGRPLGLVEAKRTRQDARVGQQQARLYADCLEARFGRRPVIFYTNGYQHWIWDDASCPPRSVQGFYTRDELDLLIQRRDSRKSLANAPLDAGIVNRYYQDRAVRRVAESFERDGQRKALLVMATGSGKTRTVIALTELLMRCNWAKRVLFLADRLALVKQAVGAFKTFLPDASPVNLVEERDAEGRVYVCTYPTMMGLIDEAAGGRRRFGAGYFDLVVIDEAHRSVYQKYRAIFDYFDSFLVGLTATPREEIDRDTYHLFDLEPGVPTDAYGLDEAVADHFLVPPKGVSVEVKFPYKGIRYADLPEEQKDLWDEIEWSDGPPPDHVDPAAVNSWLFNEDTVDKVLAHLRQNGLKVAGGDRLGKTIIFAKNRHHAQFIAERFDKHYPRLRGRFARAITFDTAYAQSLIDDFSKKASDPHIAISVDMLDTGIDVPEVVNLVFFKIVRSRTKFWQMIGRGTRLCPDLFGPGDDKRFFKVFDYCGNLEFFGLGLEPAEGRLVEPLSKRVFKARLELIEALDKKWPPVHPAGTPLQIPLPTRRVAEPPGPYLLANMDQTAEERAVRDETAETLRTRVAAMNVDNFVVRPKREIVQRYARPEAWHTPTEAQLGDLREVSGLPSEVNEDEEEARRFDLIMLRLQLALLRDVAGFDVYKKQVQAIARALEEQSSIPLVQGGLELIDAIAGEEWWQDVTVPMLEAARKRLRGLAKLIEKSERKLVYTDFEDEIGRETLVELTGLAAGTDFERFRAKARHFLRSNENHVAIHKLRLNQPLTPTDLAELERMMIEAGVGTAGDLEKAKQASAGLGLFIRSLVGLDREAAKQAFSEFLAGGAASANQIHFVNLIVDHLTEHGQMSPELLYGSPFTDVSPTGPDAIFTSPQVDRMVAILREITEKATAA
ncbi:MAG: DEAD/DEAH box helicase family protein [Chloroflexota bacterium]